MLSRSHGWGEGGREAPMSPEAPSSAQRRWRVAGLGLWLVVTYSLWFDVARDDLAAALGAEAPARAITGAALASVVSRAGSQLIEAGFYFLAWKALGRRIRFGPMFIAIVSLSLLDALANSLMRWAGGGASGAWLALLVGARAIPGSLASAGGAGTALGACGLLAVGRVLGTAFAQRREGASWRGALVLTLAVWLMGRLATWWTTDLVRGMSPLP